MMRWLLAAFLALVGAWLAYGPIGRRGAGRPVARPGAAIGLGAMRAAALLLLFAILLGAPAGPPAPLPPFPVLDASASWRRATGGTLWRAALDSARATGADSVLLAGDSARVVSWDDAAQVGPGDARSRLQPALDLAAARGRAALLVTDGESDDVDAFERLGPGSRVRVLDRPVGVDAALASFEAATVATGGDTIDAALAVVAGNAPVGAGVLDVLLDGTSAARVALAPLDPFAARRVAVRVPLPRGARDALLTAVVSAAGDIEARNDTLRRIVAITDRPRAVFVSTAPDLDVREALRVLRGAVAVPARAYLRVAPGVWREEGTFAPIAEAEVARRAGESGLLVLHGDSASAGPALAAAARVRRGALVRWTPAPPPPPPRAGEVPRPAEWFLVRAPASPLAGALEALPFDSLPPIALGAPLEGGIPVLEARLARSGAPRVIAAVGGAEAVRTLRIAGSGYAPWVQRGGRSADAFTALWGAIFDWASASEGAGPGVGLGSQPLRAGEPVRWRRGGADSVVTLQLTRGGDQVDTLTLRFGADADVAESPPLAEGEWRVRDGDVVHRLVVNPSREWVPRAPRIAPVMDAPGAPTAPARPLHDASWPFVAALVLLCAEWLVRRGAGLR